MSEEPTLPTNQTILESIAALASEMRAGFAAVNHMLEQMDIRIDRLESFAHQTRSEVINLRADLKEFRSHFKEHA